MAKFNVEDDVRSINTFVGSKSDRQEVAIKRWKEGGRCGTLDIVPRFGKTRIGAMNVSRFLRGTRADNSIPFVYIVCPNMQTTWQWKEELIQYGKINNGLDMSRVRISTIGMLIDSTYVVSNSDFFILDEVHKYTSANQLNFTDSIKNAYVLGLTGSIEKGARAIKHFPIVDTITESEALTNKWISPYTEYNYCLEFPNNLKKRYIQLSKHISETTRLFEGLADTMNQMDLPDNIYFGFKSDYDLMVSMLAGKYDITSRTYVAAVVIRNMVAEIKGWGVNLNLHMAYDLNIEKYWSPDNIKNRIVTFNAFVKERTDSTAVHDDKINLLIGTIMNDTTGRIKETIVYAGTIDIAEIITDRINAIHGSTIAIAYHSKIASRPIIDETTGDYFKYQSGTKKGLPKPFGKTKLKKHYIEMIKGGLIKVIVTVQSLNEGLNIPNLKRVIAMSGTSNSDTHKQRSARVKTIDPFDSAKEGEIINLYFDDFKWDNELVISRDKQKLMKRQWDSEVNPIIKFY